LVPPESFPLEWIEIGGLNRVGFRQILRTLWQLPISTLHAFRLISRYRAAAVFSLGGYVGGPGTAAAWLHRIPMVLMEPNAIPGFANRRIARFVTKALVNFEETAKYFPAGRTMHTGLPVREEFFSLPVNPRGETFSLLITGGSRGSRTLNQAARDSWRLFRESGIRIRIVHQTGPEAFEEIRAEFAQSGLEGEIVPFIADMPAAFAEADLVVCRAGAGAVSELAAAGKPSILSPFPFAADQHQLRNAEAFSRVGAALLVLDRDMTGAHLFKEVTRLASTPGVLERMSAAARSMARPHAAQRAADLLEELA
ncbi:MAG: UDP-N-acetylglucosamine--N-acetylmuramyl-(pentapeptide) pyrophosphoryl-undecaprenol N-acetylglucosamine transferase, partial [Bryobacteraceae bacterium]|nr:UDP-N-acetylglucosamine--N-acetylmuramyl-(pentapeptide) pyrophosphoryl-undecaprenol N-acetylglucosamine transferase [Bryobacteraceae bacterium]